MLLLLRALVADQLAGFVAGDPGDVGHQIDLLGCQGEQVQRDRLVLHDPQSTPLQDLDPVRARRSLLVITERTALRYSSANRLCSQARPLSRRSRSARVLDRLGSADRASRMNSKHLVVGQRLPCPRLIAADRSRPGLPLAAAEPDCQATARRGQSEPR